MLANFGLTLDMLLVMGILLLTACLFIFTYIRVDLIAVIILVVIGVTRILSPEQLFLGFSSEAVIALIAVMIISAGLKNVGISNKVARWMLRIGRERPQKISTLLMCTAGVLAGFMRSIGAVALFLPIIARIYARTGISKTYLLMPVTFCAMLGGTLTMVGTGPLIMLNSMLKNAYQYVHYDNKIYSFKPFGLFDIFPIGVMLLVFGIIYFIIIRKFLTPKIIESSVQDSSVKSHFKRTYEKGVEIFELVVCKKSPYINKALFEMEQQLDSSSSILAIMQGKETYFPPSRKIVIREKASIAMMGHKEVVEDFATKNDLVVLPRLNIFSDSLHPVRSGLSEAVIPPSSKLIGIDVKDLHMRHNYKLQIISLYRGNKVYTGIELNDLAIRSGDTLGMYSSWEALRKFQKEPDYVIVTTVFPYEKTYPKKMPQALFFFFLAFFLVLFRFVPISVGLLLGATGMIATKVITFEKAYESISWKTVFLLGGLMPLGLAMQTTGTADWFSKLILTNGNSISQGLMQVFLAIVTTGFALLISNIGATVLLIPVAFDLAINMGVDPKIYAIIVALSASNTFLLPTNGATALIAGPGGYRSKEFLIYGGSLSVIFFVVVLVLVNLLY